MRHIHYLVMVRHIETTSIENINMVILTKRYQATTDESLDSDIGETRMAPIGE